MPARFCGAALLFLAAACGAGTARADEWQLWQEGSFLSPPASFRSGVGWKVALGGDGLHPHAGELKPRVQHRLLGWLDAAATYKLARTRDPANGWSSSHALELDVVPAWESGGGAKVQFTQRLALARLFEAASVAHRYHAIPAVSWPARWLPAQTRAEASLEAIFDVGGSRWVEAKLTPLRLHFAMGGSGGWSLAYLIQEKRGFAPPDRRRDHVIVVAVTLNPRSRS